MNNKLFLDTINEFGMIRPGERICVGFSGGADSVCLLSLLYEFRLQLGIELTAAHVNHGLRGAESDADESFVRDFCIRRNIPLNVLRTDIENERCPGESTELCARRVRYAYFESLSADKIATAHTGSDTVETMLLNLGRGTSAHGLRSIPPVRGKFIRPLIRFTRSDTEAYCADKGLQFRTDRSNDTDIYTRNRVRHQVVPSIKNIFPSFETAALRCIDSLRAEDDYLTREAEKYFSEACVDKKLSVNALLKLHPAIRLRVLTEYISSFSDASVEYFHLQQLSQNLSENGFAITLPGAVCIRTNGEYVYIDQHAIKRESDAPCQLNKNNAPELIFNDIRLKFEQVDYARREEWNCQFIDYNKIDDIIEIRNAVPGDVIRLPKRNCSKTLKKLYMENGISAYERRLYPVITDSRGLIWAYSAGADESRLADNNTKKILMIQSEVVGNDK